MQINTIINKWQIINLDILKIKNTFDKSLMSEDMFQIKKEDYIIDSGWYDNQNVFLTFLIHNEDWESPIIFIKSFSLQHCIHAIELTIEYANSVLDINV